MFYCNNMVKYIFGEVMKIKLLLSLVFCSYVLMAQSSQDKSVFSEYDVPRLSPKAFVSHTVGYTSITINYSRPAAINRKIFGGLVPFNKLWRTGANEATTIKFTTDVTIKGKKIEAGNYSLFTIPGEKEWTIILNNDAYQFGAFNYNDSLDAYRFTVTPEKAPFEENMQFSFSQIEFQSAVINLTWEETKVSFKVEVDVLEHAYNKIREVLAKAGPEHWELYVWCADYICGYNVYLDKALAWIDRAINLSKGDYEAYYVKAKILEKMGRSKEALSVLEKSRIAGRTSKFYEYYKLDILENLIKQKNK